MPAGLNQLVLVLKQGLHGKQGVIGAYCSRVLTVLMILIMLTTNSKKDANIWAQNFGVVAKFSIYSKNSIWVLELYGCSFQASIASPGHRPMETHYVH